MYSLNGHGEMLADDLRTGAYVDAIRKSVKPGAVVLDIGTGTGLFAMIACQAGARRVYAIEPDAVIDVARQMASANALGHSIEFIQALSTQVTLPEPVDVIVSDLRGVLPFFQGHIPAISDARRRFLKPGGVQIAQKDTIWLSCIEAPELHESITAPWTGSPYGLAMTAVLDLTLNQWRRADIEAGQMITPPQCCGEIDYETVEETGFRASVSVRANRNGTCHGVGVWFDSLLADGVQLSNSPDAPRLIYGKAFFPWPRPIPIEKGDSINVDLKCELVDGEYVWVWESSLRPARGAGAVHFRQSEFFGQPLSLAQIKRLSASYVPGLSPEGKIDCVVLALMQEGHCLGEIATRLVSLHPATFSSWQNALARVARVSAAYRG